jgi:hypothetical protein
VAGDTVTLALHGEVSLDQFAEAVSRFRKLVRALSDEVGARDVAWQLADLQYSSAIATAQGISTNGGRPDQVERVVRSYLEVGQSLAAQEPVPFRRAVQREAEGLTAVLKNGLEAVRFETADDDAIVRTAAPGVAILAAPTARRESYGAVTGRVQTLTSRSALRFTLYDRLHDRAVSCYLAEGRESMMREMWDRIATVEGRITRDPDTGRPLAVRRITRVTPIEEVGPQDYQRARGALPPEPGREGPEAVIRRLRDDW